MDILTYIAVCVFILTAIVSIIEYYNQNSINENEITHGYFVMYSNTPNPHNTLTGKRNQKELNKLTEENISINLENKRYEITYVKRFKESNLSFYYTLSSIVDLKDRRTSNTKQVNI